MKLALYFGSDIISLIILNKLVKNLNFGAIQPVVFFPKSGPINPDLSQEIKNFLFFERVLPQKISNFLKADSFSEAACVSPDVLRDQYKLEMYEVENINSQEHKNFLEVNKIECGISIRCYQKFSSEIISYYNRKNFLVNLHPGKLPEQRGLFSPLRNIISGENKFYLTLHDIDEYWDRGPVILEKFIQDSFNTVFEAYTSYTDLGVNMIFEFLKRYFSDGMYISILQNDNLASYFSYPSKEEIATCRENGIIFYNPTKVLDFYVDIFSSPNSNHSERLKIFIIKEYREWLNNSDLLKEKQKKAA